MVPCPSHSPPRGHVGLRWLHLLVLCPVHSSRRDHVQLRWLQQSETVKTSDVVIVTSTSWPSTAHQIRTLVKTIRGTESQLLWDTFGTIRCSLESNVRRTLVYTDCLVQVANHFLYHKKTPLLNYLVVVHTFRSAVNAVSSRADTANVATALLAIIVDPTQIGRLHSCQHFECCVWQQETLRMWPQHSWPLEHSVWVG